MADLFERLDMLAGIGGCSGSRLWLDRAAFAFLVLLAVSAPHSIAATQTSWLAGMLLTVIRLFTGPRVRLRFGIIDYALCGLFLWTALSAVTSYDPATSIDKLRGAGLFLIVYFVRLNIRNLRAAAFIGVALVISSMVNVVWMPIERAVGRGVEIHGVVPEGPLAKAKLMDGDTLLSAGRTTLRSPEDVVAAIQSTGETEIVFYRPDFEFAVKVGQAGLLPGETALEQLGIGSWKKSRNWRSRGFYSHFTTYAESLQLIASLTLGLIVAGLAAITVRRQQGGVISEPKHRHLIMLAVAFVMMGLALLLTVTRASQLALMISSAIVVMLGIGRKWLLIALVICIPIAAGGLYFLQRSRNVGFFDSADESTRYRKVMLRDGVRILTDSPRNLVFGVGVDSVKKYWREWGMFEGGNLAVSHFHSTPLQLAVERGLPALLIWLVLMAAYLQVLWLALRRRVDGWLIRGIILGALGGTIGFLASSLVHYNYGDQEVVMIWYLIMGISLAAIYDKRADGTVPG